MVCGGLEVEPPARLSPEDRLAAPPEPAKRRRGVLAVSAAAHLAVALAVFAQAPEPTAPPGLATETIDVTWVTAGEAGDAAAPSDAAAPAPPADAPAEPQVAPQEQPVEAERPPEPPRPEPVPPEPTETAEIAPKPEPRAEPALEPPPQRRVEPPPPPLRAERPARAERRAPRPAPAPRAPARTAAQASTPRSAEGAPGPAPSRGRAGADGGSPTPATYLALVRAEILRRRVYPPDALARGEQGVVTLSLSISGTGAITAHQIVRGSGSRSLDLATAALARRLTLPPPPGGPLTVSVAVQYVTD